MSLYRLYVQYDEQDVRHETFQEVNFRTYVRTFFRETSVEGCFQLVWQPGIIKKIFWLIAIGLCLAGLIWELDIFMDKFLSGQTSTDVSIIHGTELYFPAVTLCNNNPVLNDWYDDVYKVGATPPPKRRRKRREVGVNSGPTNLIGPQGGYVNSGSGRRERLSSMEERYERNPPERPDFDDKIQEDLSIQAQAALWEPEERMEAGHQLCDMVLECQYGGVACDISKKFTTWHWSPTYGNCYTFNAGYQKANTPYQYSGHGNAFEIKKGNARSSGVLKATSLGDKYGLYLLLNADLENYIPSTTTVGWRIVVHNQTEMPFPEERGILVGPGSSTRITMTLQHAKKLGVVSNYIYDSVYSNCVDGETLNLEDPNNAYTAELEVTYSAAACKKTCYQRNVMERCGCFDFNYPNRGASFASIANYNKLKPCTFQNETQWRCQELISLKFRKGLLTCNCPETCRVYSLDTKVSTVKWPSSEREPLSTVCGAIRSKMRSRVFSNDSLCTSKSHLVEVKNEPFSHSSRLISQLKDCKNKRFHQPPLISEEQVADYLVGKQFGEVYIHYQDFTYQTIEESQLYDLSELLAYLGGILGLFFGVSFMTLFEYIQFAFELIVIACAKLCFQSSKGGNKVRSIENPMEPPRRSPLRPEMLNAYNRPYPVQPLSYA